MDSANFHELETLDLISQSHRLAECIDHPAKQDCCELSLLNLGNSTQYALPPSPTLLNSNNQVTKSTSEFF